MPGMLKYSLPVKKGFFVMRFFAFRMEMQRVQAEKLQYDEEQEEYPGQA